MRRVSEPRGASAHARRLDFITAHLLSRIVSGSPTHRSRRPGCSSQRCAIREACAARTPAQSSPLSAPGVATRKHLLADLRNASAPSCFSSTILPTSLLTHSQRCVYSPNSRCTAADPASRLRVSSGTLQRPVTQQAWPGDRCVPSPGIRARRDPTRTSPRHLPFYPFSTGFQLPLRLLSPAFTTPPPTRKRGGHDGVFERRESAAAATAAAVSRPAVDQQSYQWPASRFSASFFRSALARIDTGLGHMAAAA